MTFFDWFSDLQHIYSYLPAFISLLTDCHTHTEWGSCQSWALVHATTHSTDPNIPLTFAFGQTQADLPLTYLKDLSLKDKHSAAVVCGCLGRSAHTRMSWLMPRHSNGSCLHWSGLNSWPSRPPPPAICGMAAADILKGLKNRQEASLQRLVFGTSQSCTQLCSCVLMTYSSNFHTNVPAMREQ